MEKNNMINKSVLCAENTENCSNYENFTMQILSRSSKETNVLAITTDTNKIDLISIVGLNVGYNLACHNKKVLLINLDTTNSVLNDLFLKQNDNDNIISYGKIDIILPESTDFVGNMDLNDLKTKCSDYDFVILCVPSPKYFCNYLAVPEQTEYYLLVSRYISSFYSLNKCINKIVSAKSIVVGGVYTKFKKKK